MDLSVFTSTHAQRKLVLGGLSFLILLALGVGGFSLSILVLTAVIQWWLYQSRRYYTGIAVQALLLVGLKVAAHFQVLPGGQFPLGVSYFSLTVVALHIESLRKQQPAVAFPDFFLLVSYFPKFFAGPIERAGTFLPALDRAGFLDREKIAAGLKLFFWGALKKFVVADPLWPLASAAVVEPGPKDWIFFLTGLYALAIHFYAEFSGYVDMARGLSRCLGIELSRNFNKPFLARNPQDFWQRWHITLSTWLRDYIHYPVFFRTKMVWAAVFASFMVMALWHGFSSNFLAMGVYWFVLVIIYSELKPLLLRYRPETRRGADVWAAVSITLMFHLSCFAFFLLYAKDWWNVLDGVDWAAFQWNAFHQQALVRLAFFLLPFAIYHTKRLPASARIGFLLYFAFLVMFFEGSPLRQTSEARRVEFMYFQF